MQTSKIKINEVYAVKFNGITARFRVTKIVTQRGMGRTSNTVHGVIQDASPGKPPGVETAYDPENIIGPYAENAELVRREQEAKERARAEAQAKADRAEAIFAAFCKHIGHPKPKKVKEYSTLKYHHSEPFRLDYSECIEIDRQGMEILAKFLRVDFVDAEKATEKQQQEVSNVVTLNNT